MAESERGVRLELDHAPFDRSSLVSAVGEELAGLGVDLVVTDPGVMRVLNRRWRHQDRVTDVLTFDLSQDPCPEGPRAVIYVNGRVAPPIGEVLERVYHGILHLRGLSHDREEGRRRMEELTKKMVQQALERAEPC